MDIIACKTSEIDEQGRKILDIDGFEVAIFRLDDTFYAYENNCPHAGGPACQGKILPLTQEAVDDQQCSSGRVFSKQKINVVCPWHGMEFDIRSGEHPLTRRFRLRKIPLRVEGQDIVLTLKPRAH
jgi:nitrite reductase/ring-hydroxylating ferredoxin subunit